MNLRSFYTVTTFVVAVCLLAGCSPSEEDDGPPLPKQVEFKGQVEPKLVGSWATPDGKAALDLKKDGAATILATSDSPGGPVKSTLEGSWLVEGDNLLLKYNRVGQPFIVIKSPYSLSGKEMTVTSSIGVKTTYKKRG